MNRRSEKGERSAGGRLKWRKILQNNRHTLYSARRQFSHQRSRSENLDRARPRPIPAAYTRSGKSRQQGHRSTDLEINFEGPRVSCFTVCSLDSTVARQRKPCVGTFRSKGSQRKG